MIQVDVAEAIVAFTALLVAMGVPAVLAARRSKHAVRAAEESRSALEGVAEQVRPENGRRLGELAQSTAKLVEVIDGRLHDVSKRVDAQGWELVEIRKHNAGIEAQLIATGQAVNDVGDGLKAHLEEISPLVVDLEALKRAHEQEE